MVFNIALKFFLPPATGISTVFPVSYLATSGVVEATWGVMAYKNGKNCKHLPLNASEQEKKLLVCVAKTNNKPVFKWWTRDSGGGQEGKIQDIKTLS